MTPETRFRMHAASWLGLSIGVGIAAVLVVWQGADAIAGLLASTGWRLLLVAVFAVPSLVLSTASWRLLFPPGRAPRFAPSLTAMWIGSSINLLLPVAGVGGEIVRARLIARGAGNTRDAVASVVVDKTVQIATIPLVGLIGIGALLPLGPDAGSVGAALAIVVLLALAIAALVLAQRSGAVAFLAARAIRFARSAKWEGLVERASDLDGAIRALYRPGRIAASCALRLLARLSLAGEVWLAAALLGHPIGFLDAIALKCIAMVAGTLAFPVPAGLGVQEGTFVALGTLVGLPPHVALATSLATRVREIVVSLPGLLVWEYVEGRALWRRRAA